MSRFVQIPDSDPFEALGIRALPGRPRPRRPRRPRPTPGGVQRVRCVWLRTPLGALRAAVLQLHVQGSLLKHAKTG